MTPIYMLAASPAIAIDDSQCGAPAQPLPALEPAVGYLLDPRRAPHPARRALKPVRVTQPPGRGRQPQRRRRPPPLLLCCCCRRRRRRLLARLGGWTLWAAEVEVCPGCCAWTLGDTGPPGPARNRRLPGLGQWGSRALSGAGHLPFHELRACFKLSCLQRLHLAQKYTHHLHLPALIPLWCGVFVYSMLATT